MSLTLGNWIAIGCVFLFPFAISVIMIFDVCRTAKENAKYILISAGVCLVIAGMLALFLNWYNTNTASGLRNYKDFESELSNGINREITITAEDGRQIYYYKGRFDVETDHEDNYIKFEREDGMREIIYYGITDTVIITEIGENSGSE